VQHRKFVSQYRTFMGECFEAVEPVRGADAAVVDTAKRQIGMQELDDIVVNADTTGTGPRDNILAHRRDNMASRAFSVNFALFSTEERRCDANRDSTAPSTLV